MTLIVERIQSLSPGSIVSLYELDLSPITGTNTADDHLYFVPDTNKQGSSVVWQGVTYTPFPVEATGFEVSSQGTLPRPTLLVSNITGAITALIQAKGGDLTGAKMIRRRTFVEYLDAVNFPGGNVKADPTQFLPDDVYYINRKTSHDKFQVSWELVSALDLEGQQLPNRMITATYCAWKKYRGPECGYTGTNYFDVNNNPVGSLALDVCSKSVAGCKARFGAKAMLPFGGFPASRVYRV